MKKILKNPYSLARKGISSLIASESMEATLDKKFKHQSFLLRFRWVNMSLMISAFMVQVSSLITAGFMLYHSFSNVPEFLRWPLMLAIILAIEIIKRIALDDTLKSAFQYLEFEIFSFCVAAVFVVFSLSISYGGAEFVALELLPDPVAQQTLVKSDSSIQASYEGQIAAIVQERDTLRATRLYYGKLSREDQRSINTHNNRIHELENAKRLELESLAKENKNAAVISKAEHLVLMQEVKAERQALKKHFQYAVVVMELCLLLCLTFSWWYYNECRKEKLGFKDGTAAVEEQTGERVTAAAVAVGTPAVTAAVTPGQAPPITSQKKIGFIDYQAPQTAAVEEPSTPVDDTNKTVEVAAEYTRKCPVCKKGFIHNSWNHKYCSEDCKIKAWEKRHGRKYKKYKKA